MRQAVNHPPPRPGRSPAAPECDYSWVGFANPTGAAALGKRFEGSPSESRKRRWILCGGGRPRVARVARGELDPAGRRPAAKRRGAPRPGSPHAPQGRMERLQKS